MISSKNKPVNNLSTIRDFTTIQYRELLILAKKIIVLAHMIILITIKTLYFGDTI